MKNTARYTIFSFVLMLAAPAMADQLIVGGKATRWNLYQNPEFGRIDTHQASVGYQFGGHTGLSLTPAVHVGIGRAKDPVVNGPQADWDSFYGGSLRVMAENNRVYAFVQPGYSRFEQFLGFGNTAVVSQNWEFGLNSGVGIKFGDQGRFRVEVGYDKMDYAEGMNVGFQMTF